VEIHRSSSAQWRTITHFGSRGVALMPVTRIEGRGQVVRLALEPGGVIGRHRAGTAQVLLVLTGTGWVGGEDGERHLVAPGDRVVWSPGEEHETATDGGMTALVVECESLEVGSATVFDPET